MPIRLALICDYIEEGWLSMDLTGEMILVHLQRHFGDEIEPTRILPPFQRRFGGLPGLGSRKAAFNADRIVNRHVDYPRYLKRLVREREFDVFHVVDQSYAQLVRALPKNRTIVTCHDMDTFRCLFEPAVEPRPFWFRALARRTLDGLSKAAGVACDSDATRSGLIERGVLPEDRLRTIHLGTHPECSPRPDPASDAEAERLLGPRPDDPTRVELLHVGSNIPRKRIDVLLDAFAGVRREWPNARLVKIGGAWTDAQAAQVERLGLRDAVTTLPFFSPLESRDRAALAAVYRRVDVLLQPSDAEGFGLPLAEAMGCGTPIVASDIPVLREVAGDRAEYAPVGQIDAWVEAISEILRRPRRLVVGPEEQRPHRWSRHAGSLMDLYRGIVENEGSAARRPRARV